MAKKGKKASKALAARAYLRLTGETQGEIEGSVTRAGHEGSLEIYGWSHELVSPRDAASGLPTGKRQHKPLIVTKPIDRASPLLMTALTTNENITDWELAIWRPSRSGKESLAYTIQLVNATIAGVQTEMLDNRIPENQRQQPFERIAFTYQKIIWTWVDGGITAEDDWEAPVA